ncbi:anhydro-N-acetylmuramic acid kinase [Catenovulum sp. 2E275]|uniref:anhydro-N-acetylmuramic acid kinase n=1 Tax=Catenovulum sp. 2E275 TaxID=2980497 RepID=UPI0021D191C1|nr:anhydro-N-acetylmuramic acid kinase [Catenovulum sp. 2E275]MCU4677463.1 anhydro-N-acetylmuramic acid kinase [Catenovulum sp. 2E275]
MQELYIGLMSGTSADGVDASLISLDNGKITSLSQSYLAFDRQFKRQIIALYQTQKNEIEVLGQTACQLSEVYAQAVFDLLAKSNVSATQITAIGCHGQTIRHRPDLTTPFTLQICDYAKLAELVGIDVIGDFRSADIAAGGQGAPLVPAFHKAIFPAAEIDQVVVNIGGIANLTLIKNNGYIAGFDTGPGNGLMDEWCEFNTGQPYDKNGRWAGSGQSIQTLLDKLLTAPFFTKKGPKSSGREVFNLSWLQHYLTEVYSAQDVQATLLNLTSQSIAQAIQNVSHTADVWVCGGGVHNQTLMQQLQADLGYNYRLNSTQVLNIAPDWIEADCFAWLAYCFKHKIPANLPQVTGAKKTKILGCLYPF